ncbi:hypothetical protein JB92DRAFT_2912504 [Gautieria morchelliformis]|nr:hypothetical protein JB92DRAFT_2912504 [Gautieria morchelliformis]
MASYSLTVFSPSGKLVQIEHALATISQGTTSLGIKATNGNSLCSLRTCEYEVHLHAVHAVLDITHMPDIGLCILRCSTTYVFSTTMVCTRT